MALFQSQAGCLNHVFKPREVKTRLTNKRLSQKLCYDRSSRPLQPLMVGQTVRLQTPQGYNRTGVVKEICKEPRSYLIHTEGKQYRRNRRHILPVSEPVPAQFNLSDTDHLDSGLGSKDNNTGQRLETMDTEQLQDEIPVAKLPSNTTENLYKTRSGRVSKPNPKYRD